MTDSELRNYIDIRLIDIKDLLLQKEATAIERSLATREFINIHLNANKTAVSKAESTMSIRLESMNAFRDQIQSERGTFVLREMFDERMAAISSKLEQLIFTNLTRIETLEKHKAQLDGKFTMLGMVLGGLVIVLNLLSGWVFRAIGS